MYVDAIHNRNKDVIQVVERVNGVRKYLQYPTCYLFYYPDPSGHYRSIYDEPLALAQFTSSKKFYTEKKRFSQKYSRLYESDVNPVFRCLETHYNDATVPDLHKAFFDIETDFDDELGFAEPSDPFNKITAIGIHCAWLNRTICLAIKPDTLSKEQATEICNRFDDTFLMDSEEEMLIMFLQLVNDADTLSGWNSTGFDIPYIVNRIALVLGKDYTKQLCLWDQYPTRREYEKFGKTHETFDLTGRIHLDYLDIYRKYTYHEMHSYSLDAISEYELGDTKIPYEGTLDQLYNYDFEKFIAYNRQDTDLLRKLDDKLQFIDLSILIAHANMVLLKTTLGSVSQIDFAIITEAHAMGFKVPDKDKSPDTTPAAGAYVAKPKVGLHRDIGSIDLNSLYPSIIRSCNMSPETIVGQIRQTLTEEMISQFETVKKAWEGKFACLEYDLVMSRDKNTVLHLDMQDGVTYEATGYQLYELIFMSDNPWVLSANGTIFRTDKQGIIPHLLDRWYSERKELQTKAKSFRGVDEEQFKFWDKRQLVKKILLNSLYGALLNAGCRFFDKRLGQSTTLTGRSISRHMAAQTNKIITGTYDYAGKSIIYGDTDSVYFSAYPTYKDQIDSGNINWDKETIIKLYDEIAEQVNQSFPRYMKEGHNCPHDFGRIIAAGREIVGDTGLFIKQKRYAIQVYDDEGQRKDIDGSPGKTKALGLDLKRSDTPKYMQEFLTEILTDVLTGSPEPAITTKVKEFRKMFRQMPSWEKGTPKRVNKLTYHTNVYNRTGKCAIGHALAAINYNRLREMNGDRHSMKITDGMKTIVCKLKDNPLGMTSIGYPTDEGRIPDWFKELPFDDKEMEETIITKKIENLLGVLDWDLRESIDTNNFSSLFSLR